MSGKNAKLIRRFAITAKESELRSLGVSEDLIILNPTSGLKKIFKALKHDEKQKFKNRLR